MSLDTTPPEPVTRNGGRNVTRRNAPLTSAERQRRYRERRKAQAQNTAKPNSQQSDSAKPKSPALPQTDTEFLQTNGVIPAQRKQPVKYTPEIGREICERIALREPLSIICQDPRMPSEREVYRWKAEQPEFGRDYALAREARAETRADRIDSYMEQLRAGKLDGHTCRVLIDGEKWQASKEQPRVYGDKVDLTSAGERLQPVDAGAAIEALLAALPSLVPALPAIEVEALPAPSEPEGDA